MRSKPSEITHGRRGERGAALVMSLLIAMLLLAAGGALIATAGMTVSNAVDSTAEAQAYYAADAGLQAALTVIRRNRAGANGLEANFHTFACGTAAACTNDGDNLSQWLGGATVTLSASPALSYSVTVTDPSRPTDPTDPNANLAADYTPRYLHVRSVGRGPQGAVKVMEMMVDRFKFAYDAPAPLVLRESQDGTNHVGLAPGPGQPNLYSGTDVSNPSVTKPAVGVGQTLFNSNTDLAVASAAMASETMTGGVGAVGTAGTPWPPIVANAPAAASTVAALKGFATSTTCPGNSTALSGFTFIEGDCTLGPQNSGSGFLVITGKLTASGNFNFSGLVFVLGSGQVERSGGGGGTIQGGILAAKFTGNGSGGFGAVDFDTSGGGNSKIRYNSKAIEDALAVLGPRAIGVVEK
jgi:hypothetical protein